MSWCGICRGARVIRLHEHQRIAAAPLPADVPIDATTEVTVRTYPCPECGVTVPQERVAIIEHHVTVESDPALERDPEFRRYAKENAAHALVHELLEGGFIRYRRGPADSRDLVYPMVATLGVVSPKHAATLEQRIAVRAEDLAREVIEEASRQIRIWGSAKRTSMKEIKP